VAAYAGGRAVSDVTNKIDWKAALDGTRPVTTRDGKKVTLYCVDAPGGWPVHGRVGDGGTPTAWRKNGFRETHRKGDFDLIQPPLPPKPFKRELWMNVYKETFPLEAPVGKPHLSKADAMEAAMLGQTRIACVHVVVEGNEGDGL